MQTGDYFIYVIKSKW